MASQFDPSGISSPGDEKLFSPRTPNRVFPDATPVRDLPIWDLTSGGPTDLHPLLEDYTCEGCVLESQVLPLLLGIWRAPSRY